MHLLAATPGAIADGSEAVDLGQTPGDIVILSAADTELSGLSKARGELGANFPSLRLANLMQLSHNMSVDLYLDEVLRHAKLVIVRLLGGRSYWSYGVEQLQITAEEEGFQLVLLPGDATPDPELAEASSLSRDSYHRLWRYFVEGGPDNLRHALAYAACLIGKEVAWQEPRELLSTGLYWPGEGIESLGDLEGLWIEGAPVAAIVFYRAHYQAGNLLPIDAMIEALKAEGINPLPIYAASLKDPLCAGVVERFLTQSNCGIVLNGTGFALSSPGAARKQTPFDKADCPVLQVVFAGSNEASWREGSHGLSARDIAMNVALPEVDGRIISRAASFKGESTYDEETQCSLVSYQPLSDRVSFIAKLAGSWLRLRQTKAEDRKVAIVLANYPNRDGRLGNGVGLDTPAATHCLLKAMQAAGYHVEQLPKDGQSLIERLAEGPTNALEARQKRSGGEELNLAAYQDFFAKLPKSVRDKVTERWGPPEDDPFFDRGLFRLAAFKLGKIIIGLQPARGYNIDPVKSYHDPDLVPPHGYLAFYAWLRETKEVHAILHMGKHGNLEWLPGKALALSEECFPEAVLGPLPHIYPFIVNDPGEGTQAKRRSQAVIVDHLTPPLTRAESYGPLADLEQLVDEYYEAAGVDPRRLALLRKEILQVAQSIGLDSDCGIGQDEGEDSALAKLDNYLCELKEMQIRDGLHIFGRAPEGEQLQSLLAALLRIPRNEGKGEEASILRALAQDLDLAEGFDPLICDLGQAWKGARPQLLEIQSEAPWRTTGDTVERLEELVLNLIKGEVDPKDCGSATQAVMDYLERDLRRSVAESGAAEIRGTLTALDGRFLLPGPSGAPTRGRHDVLPTGRNFYSVDSRTVPTPAAWQLGWKSASLLIERHRQEQGEWPSSLALSAWGTANMRTGGDDIAQALALLGVKPTWEATSRRVTGFEILPATVLGRPRVDITLRVSGFFRDAFPAQIDLFDSAVRAVAELDEPAEQNPLAARVKADAAELERAGEDAQAAQRQAAYRVFGSMPGAYGAGLQAMIDERGWQRPEDLAEAYLAWSGFAYGGGAGGQAQHALFRKRLKTVEAVVHNQDNREHDLLDSDDYYQFEGGLAVSIQSLQGAARPIYHNDHSRPERPVIRSLEEEIGRVVRARVVNPKWIEGVMRHGYKGAFEMAASVDYLFAFAATTGAVKDHHFDAVYEAFLENDKVRDFIEEANPAALKEIAERLREALQRGLWKPKANSAYHHLEDLIGEELQ